MAHSALALASATASSGFNSSAVISILGGLIAALIAIAGGVGTWAALRVAKNAQVIANYEAIATSWEKRANSLKAENEGLEEEVRDLKAENADLKAKNSALQDVVTGHSAVKRLASDVNDSFQALSAQVSNIQQQLGGGK